MLSVPWDSIIIIITTIISSSRHTDQFRSFYEKAALGTVQLTLVLVSLRMSPACRPCGSNTCPCLIRKPICVGLHRIPKKVFPLQ